MHGLVDISYFFGGAFFANAAPHVVSGVMGRPFRTPFAKPRGSLSSSTTNVAWGFFNLLVAYVLLLRVGAFDLRDAEDAAAFGLGALLLSLFLSRVFAKTAGAATP